MIAHPFECREENVGSTIDAVVNILERAHVLPGDQQTEVEKLARHILLRVGCHCELPGICPPRLPDLLPTSFSRHLFATPFHRASHHIVTWLTNSRRT
jgi:hypothetical protein